MTNLRAVQMTELHQAPSGKMFQWTGIYDESKGCPDDGIAPGTLWKDVPMNWSCPECGARKDDFEMSVI